MLMLFAISLLSVTAQTVYQEPDFKTKLVDPIELSVKGEQQLEWARALTAIARNFTDDLSVSPRAKAMGLVLALQLQPYDRDALIGSYHLRRSLEPTPTSYYLDKKDVITRLQSSLAQPGATDADRVWQTLIKDVLDELTDGERSDGLAWKRTVMPPARPLKRSSASVTFMDSLGASRTWSASGRIDESSGFSANVRGEPFTISKNVIRISPDIFNWHLGRTILA